MANDPGGSAAHQIRVLFSAGAIGRLGDAELLERFVAGGVEGTEAAFAVLVERHGPMVLRASRQALGNEHDAQDAFQAVFFVLARKAHSLHARGPLGPWLHQVAVRTALHIRAGVARRARHERRAAELAAETVTDKNTDDLGAAMQEELARLPAKYRLPIVLCHMEGLTNQEAALQLGWPAGTVRSRIARGLERLRVRLTRRGLAPSAVASAAALCADAAWSAVPPWLVETTSRAAVIIASGQVLAGVLPASVLSISEGVLSAMAITRLKFLAASLLIGALSAAGGAAALAIATRHAISAQPTPENQRGGPQREDNVLVAGPSDLAVKGLVVNPGGTPIPDAKLYLLDYPHSQARTSARSVSDGQGRFSFRVPGKDLGLNQPHNWKVPWTSMYVVATAEGYAPALVRSPRPGSERDLTLRLVADSVLVKGRVRNLEGKPVPGATLRVTELAIPDGKLSDWLEGAKSSEWNGRIDSPCLESLFPPATTDKDGRFELRGIGADRVVILTLRGPGLETSRLAVVTANSGLVYLTDPGIGTPQAMIPCYGAEFEHPAAPSRLVMGVVRDRVTMKPLAGVTIAGPQERTTTDTEGRFTLAGLPRKGGPIVAAPPISEPYLALEKRVPDRPGLDPETVDFELKRGVLVKGRVTDQATGNPVCGEVSYFVSLDNPNRDQADGLPGRVNGQGSPFGTCPIGKDGAYQLVVLPGRGIIAAEIWGNQYLVGVGAADIKGADQDGQFPAVPMYCQPGFDHRLAEIDPEDGDRFLTRDLAVDPGRTVTGVLQGPDGQPLAGALAFGLRFNDHGPYWEPSDDPLPTAAFTVYGIRTSERRKVVFLHNKRRLARSLVPTGNEKSPMTVKLEPWGTVTGRLIDASGRSLAGVGLGFAYGAFTPPDQGTHPDSFQTDKDGRFRVAGLVPDMKYTLGTVDPGLGHVTSAVFRDLTVKPGETRDLGDVQLGTTDELRRTEP